MQMGKKTKQYALKIQHVFRILSHIHVSHELAVVILLLAASDLEKIIFDNNIVGLKIFIVTSWKVAVT